VQLQLLRTVPTPDGLRPLRLLPPKNSTKAQLLEAKDNLQQMLVAIPLTDDERAAVEDGQAALNALVAKLTKVPSPAGPTPRQLGITPTVTVTPNVEFRPTRRTAGT
jgi:hypothetical protein